MTIGLLMLVVEVIKRLKIYLEIQYICQILGLQMSLLS